MIPKLQVPSSKKNLAIYIHWPFCLAKCPYCDFNSHVSDSIDHALWQNAYIKEIESFKSYISEHQISSIFIGGGTPTLMHPKIVARIIEYLQNIAVFTEDIEITLEGNPTSVESNKLQEFKSAGINRVSLGVQSLNSDDLKFLGRQHSPDEATQAIEIAASLFDNYSFDLIYARPGQTLSKWEKELRYALSFVGKHISLYQLTIEKGTPFFSEYNSGKFTLPDNDEAANLYLLTRQIMQEFKMPAYEVSNHAVDSYYSRHNMSYWRYHDYLGIGPGAHSRITMQNNKYAIMMDSSPVKWLNNIQNLGSSIQTKQMLTMQDMLHEIIMMGLRTVHGVDRVGFKNIINQDVVEFISSEKLIKLEDEGLIEKTDDYLRCTEKGILMLNSIASCFEV